MTWSLEISTFTKLPTNSNGYHILKPLDKASFIVVFLHSLFHTDGKNKEETNVQNLGGIGKTEKVENAWICKKGTP